MASRCLFLTTASKRTGGGPNSNAPRYNTISRQLPVVTSCFKCGCPVNAACRMGVSEVRVTFLGYPTIWVQCSVRCWPNKSMNPKPQAIEQHHSNSIELEGPKPQINPERPRAQNTSPHRGPLATLKSLFWVIVEGHVTNLWILKPNQG